jgi:hypothetical protein
MLQNQAVGIKGPPGLPVRRRGSKWRGQGPDAVGCKHRWLSWNPYADGSGGRWRECTGCGLIEDQAERKRSGEARAQHSDRIK